MLEEARRVLQKSWSRIQTHPLSEEDALEVDSNIRDAMDRAINSKTLTYRYVLPTQLLAKLVDPSLDCRAVQEGAELSSPFDARSLCHGVVVPFDRDNDDVLGGSTEPYVNNPLRILSITPEFRAAQKNKQGFDDLCAVLSFAEEHPKLVRTLWALVLGSVHRRLASVRVVYPAPIRVSLGAAMSALATFLTERSGGVRLQAAAVAILRTVGSRLQLFTAVKSAAVNASDASTGLAADLICVDDAGQVVLAVEVKDRQLTLRHMQDKLPGTREQGVRELLFLVKGGVENADRDGIRESVDREFSVGQNIYVCEFDAFTECCLVLFGEEGRRELMLSVGAALDELRIDIEHRRTWRVLLEGM